MGITTTPKTTQAATDMGLSAGRHHRKHGHDDNHKKPGAKHGFPKNGLRNTRVLGGIGPGLAGCQKVVYVFWGPNLLWQRSKTDKYKAP